MNFDLTGKVQATQEPNTASMPLAPLHTAAPAPELQLLCLAP